MIKKFKIHILLILLSALTAQVGLRKDSADLTGTIWYASNEYLGLKFFKFADDGALYAASYLSSLDHNEAFGFWTMEDKELFISACKFIGLFNENNEQWENYKKNKASISESEINSKIELRNKARANKDYKEADRIREELFDKGVLIEDKDGKTMWKFK